MLWCPNVEAFINYEIKSLLDNYIIENKNKNELNKLTRLNYIVNNDSQFLT